MKYSTATSNLEVLMIVWVSWSWTIFLRLQLCGDRGGGARDRSRGRGLRLKGGGGEYLGRKGKQDKVFWFCDVTWQLFLGWCTGHIIILYVTLILCVWFLVNLSVRPPHLCFLECWYPRTQVALLKVNYRTIKLWCSVLLIISVTTSHQMRRETFNQTFHLHFILMVISPE